jgi:ribosomal protein L31
VVISLALVSTAHSASTIRAPVITAACVIFSAKHAYYNDRQNIVDTIADSARSSRVAKKARLEKQVIQRHE